MTALKYTVQILALAAVILLLALLLNAAINWVVMNYNSQWITRCAWAIVAAAFLIAIRKFWLNTNKKD